MTLRRLRLAVYRWSERQLIYAHGGPCRIAFIVPFRPMISRFPASRPRIIILAADRDGNLPSRKYDRSLIDWKEMIRDSIKITY